MRTALILLAAGTLVLPGCQSDDGSTSGQTITVAATDDSCEADVTEVEAGPVEITVRNDGSTVTEVYVYAEGDRVVGEIEDVTPGLTRTFEVTVGGGEYEIACKPGQTGDGIRTPLTVTGEAAAAPVPSREVEFTGVDFDYEGLDDVTFTAGEVVRFEMMNEGEVAHEFEVFGPDGDVLGEIGPTAPGEEGDVVLTLGEAGTYQYVCGIDDHEARGMAGTFTVDA